MAKLSREQIASYAKGAGFTGDEVNIATAIAFAESGGDPRSHNPKPPDDSYGLWQINMLGSLGPDRRKRFKLASNASLYDPATNARVAYGIYKGSGWSAWTTYTRGTYKEFMTGGSGGGDSSAPVAAPAGLNPINGIGDAINAFGATIFKGFANVGGIAIGITLLVVGILLLARGQVASLLPAGKAAKIAKGVLSK